jgi:hypothetical protein
MITAAAYPPGTGVVTVWIDTRLLLDLARRALASISTEHLALAGMNTGAHLDPKLVGVLAHRTRAADRPCRTVEGR